MGNKTSIPDIQKVSTSSAGKKLVLRTKDGFCCSISQDQLDDYELVDMLAQIDNGRAELLPAVLRKMFGEKQHDRLVAYVKKRDGKVSLTAMGKALSELVGSIREAKNS